MGRDATIASNVAYGGKAAVRDHSINGSRDVPRRNILTPPKPSRLVLAHEAEVADRVNGQDRGEFSDLYPRDEGFRRAMLFRTHSGADSAASLLEADEPYRNRTIE
jgi:hypothetical protein